MPVAHASLDTSSSLTDPPRGLPFPPVTKSHILNCSYHAWYLRFVIFSHLQRSIINPTSSYRSLTPRARLIPLPPAFLTYLRADGIVLPPDDGEQDDWEPSHHNPSAAPSSPPVTPPTSVSDVSEDDSDDDDDDEDTVDPSNAWSATHAQIKATITELGGAVMPKLNWSAPKDACWISATNSMECRSANDVYLLLKSSDFVVHDLEQVFDGVVDEDDEDDDEWDNDDEDDEEKADVVLREGSAHEDIDTQAINRRRRHHQQPPPTQNPIPYHLILRKSVPQLNPALEFRCFVRARSLLCLCQRDLNHYPFLSGLVPHLRSLIHEFFTNNLQHSFPDPNFAFDVYVPGPRHDRCWLVDINPWAERTDPLLFSWKEILDRPSVGDHSEGWDEDDEESGRGEVQTGDIDGSAEEQEEEVITPTPEFRLVNRDDPEAYAFNTPQYSAHKLPKEVVDAGGVGEGGIREFLGRWRELERRHQSGLDGEDDDDEGEEKEEEGDEI